MRSTWLLKALFAVICAALAAQAARAQQQIDPSWQIDWPILTAAGAPTLNCQATNPPPGATDVAVGTPYLDTTNGVEYRCSTGNVWVQFPTKNLFGSGAPSPTCSAAANNGTVYTDLTNNLFYICDGPLGVWEGPFGAAGPAGPASQQFEGLWSSSPTYTVGPPAQTVQYGSYIFVALVNNTNQTPPGTCTSNTYWMCLSSAASVSGTTGFPVYNNAGTPTTWDPSQTITPPGPYVAAQGAATTPVPGSLLLSHTWTTEKVFGDSIPAGYLSVPAAQIYTHRIAADAGISTGNIFSYAVSGALSCDIVNQALNNDAPALNDGVLRLADMGTNDYNSKGLGQYETAVTQNCEQAFFAYEGIPAANWATGGNTAPGTNWSTDTTYSQMTGLQSTTNGAVQTFSYTTTFIGQSAEILYRLIDGNGGSFTETETGGSSPGRIYANNFTLPAIATQNGGTTGVGIIHLSNVNRAVGTYTVTITVTSATGAGNIVAILGVAPVPPLGSDIPTYITAVPRQYNDYHTRESWTGDSDLRNNLGAMRGEGLTQLYYQDCRSALFSTPSEMQAIPQGQLHPSGTVGHLELRNCMEAPPAAPKYQPTVRVRTSRLPNPPFTNDNIQPWDTTVTYQSGQNANFTITLPIVPPIQATNNGTGLTNVDPVSIWLINESAFYATFVASPGTQMDATLTSYVLPPVSSVQIVAGWNSSGFTEWSLGVPYFNPFILKLQNNVSTSFTAQCNSQWQQYSNASAGVMTLPTCTTLYSNVGISFMVKDVGPGALTFTGDTSGDVKNLTLNAGDSAFIYEQNSTAWQVGPVYRASQSKQAFVTSPAWSGGGSNTWNTGSQVIANLSLSATHNTAFTLNVSNLWNGGKYRVMVTQDATATGTTTLNLGTGCTWQLFQTGTSTYYSAGTAITVPAVANASIAVNFTYDGTNCWASWPN